MSVRRSNKRLVPVLAPLEDRALQTVISPLVFHSAGHGGSQVSAALAKVTGPINHLSIPVSPSSIATGENGNQSPNPGLDPNLLTPAGKARAHFVARATGPIAVSKPSFVGDARQIFYIGNFGSSQLLHGTMVMRLDVTTKGVVSGVGLLRDRSVATTSSEIVLDLTGTTVDSKGRPTQLNWFVDASSGGAYGTAPGQGTLTITYTANGHSKGSAGGAVSVFSGLILGNSLGSNTSFNLPKFN